MHTAWQTVKSDDILNEKPGGVFRLFVTTQVNHLRGSVRHGEHCIVLHAVSVDQRKTCMYNACTIPAIAYAAGPPVINAVDAGKAYTVTTKRDVYDPCTINVRMCDLKLYLA